MALAADLPELGVGARVHGRLDRLAITDDKIFIVDFKSNRTPPTKLEDVPVYYATQMALYRMALSKIFPGRRIGSALIWTQGPVLMPLPDEFLDAQTRRIRSRLT